MDQATLYLIPNTLGKETQISKSIPTGISEEIKNIKGVLGENPHSIRRLLNKTGLDTHDIAVAVLPKDRKRALKLQQDIIREIKTGQDWGVISDAGCPGVADPGTKLVAMAHQEGIIIRPLVGPSSIILGLMASGLSGQNFAFHGYLSSDPQLRRKKIRELEKNSRRYHQTQIFMEAPYRNDYLLVDLIKTLSSDTILVTATDLTLPTEQIISQPVAFWQKSGKISLNKRPTIFLLASG